MAIRVFWLSSANPLDTHLAKTGTWIPAMYNALRERDEVDVCAVATFTTKKDFSVDRNSNTTSYFVPRSEIQCNGKPNSRIMAFIRKAIEEQKPDIIHVWGIENIWGVVISSNEYNGYLKLVDIQGIRSVCSTKFVTYAGLSDSEIRSMNKLRELMFPRFRIENKRKEDEAWSETERIILNNFSYISTQSEWVRAVLPQLVKNANIEKTGIVLRDGYMKSEQWHIRHQYKDKPVIFTIANVPRKGLHVTLKAVAIIKEKYPNVELRVAGMTRPQQSFFKGGYGSYIRKMVSDLELETNVNFLGFIEEKTLIENLYQSDVFIISSFIETYSLALAEALALGVPSVAAYSSALPELVENGETGFLYPVGDEYMCAYQVLKLLGDKELSERISLNASTWYRKEKSVESAANQQINIYKKIMAERGNLL